MWISLTIVYGKAMTDFRILFYDKQIREYKQKLVLLIH